jgi:parvulin-like peptidyl-prolyl isomerase
MTSSSQIRTNRQPRRSPRQVSLPLLVLTGMALTAAGIVVGVLITRAKHSAQQVVVSVNGHNISKATLIERVEATAGPNTLRTLVDDELHLQFAQQKGLAPDNRAVEARYASVARQPDFLRKLAANHLTPELYKRGLRAEMAAEAVMTAGVQITDAEVRQYYQTQIAKNNPTARYYLPSTIVIRIMVIGSATRAQNAAQALQSGIPFADVANRYSDDTSHNRGGLIPPFQRGRTKIAGIPGLEDAIFALKVGDHWGPRAFGKAWWLVRCEDKTPERILPFVEVADDCHTSALMAKAAPINGRRVTAEFEDFKRHAIIQTFDPAYANVVNGQ